MSLWNQAEERGRSWTRFDMRAHGRSDGNMNEFTISRALADVRLVLQLFPGRPKFLVGSSMGGWVAAQLATEQQLQIAGVVLIAPAFSFMRQLFNSLQPDQRQQWINQRFWTFAEDDADYQFTLSYDAVIDSEQYDLLRKPADFQCPVRILHGRLDDVVPVTQSIEFCRRLSPHADIELDVLPDADHRLTGHLEHITRQVDEIWPLIESKQC